MKTTHLKQKGSVSLFVVIFATLLIVIVTTAFIRVMVQEQMQATSNDLSKSALDSAYAGVEDAKRLMVEYSQNCPPGEASTRCGQLRNVLGMDVNGWTTDCMGIASALYSPDTVNNSKDGIAINANNNSDDLNQAYTCLKVNMQPQDYVGQLTSNTSRIIKLQAKNGDPTKIRLEWYATQPGDTVDVDKNATTSFYSLPQEWPENRPPVFKAQLLQYKSDFRLADFDTESDHNATLFLLPASVGASVGDNLPLSFSLDGRLSRTTGSVQNVKCIDDSKTKYACSVDISLPDLGNPDTVRTAYLKLSQFYSAINTDFRVTMFDASGNTLQFANVQAAVDSTGRANELFRRVQSRVDMGVSSVPNPESAVDVTKSLCKEFSVNDKEALYGQHKDLCERPH